MSESPNRQAAIVGLFVTFAVLILVGGIFTIGSLSAGFSRKVHVTTVFDEVNGLQAGSNIWFSGVKVGTVKHVGFAGGPRVEVEMAIDEDATPYIHNDVLAKISSDGLIGNKLVVLYEGTPEAPPIADGDVLVSGKELSTTDMMAMFADNSSSILALTTDLKVVTSKIAAGEGTAGKLLADDELYRNLTTTVASLQGASANAQAMTSNLSTFAAKMNQEGTLPNELVTDRESYASLTTSVKKLEEVATDAARVVDGLEKGATNPDSAVGALLLDEEAGKDLKQTLDNLNSGTVLLSDNLEAMQHNFLLRGFFKKKEKAKEEARESESAAVAPPAAP